MASAIVKKPCTKCNKGGGVTTCDGCQQSFCIKHIIEHRQELAIELDNVGQEHDVLRRDLTQENLEHPLLIRINEWEQEAITKIQGVAEVARVDLRKILDQNKNELKTSVDKMTNEMQACREMDDYTETDLIKWTEELKQLRHLLDTQLIIQIVDNEDKTISIPTIKIRKEESSYLSFDSNRKSTINPDMDYSDILVLNHERFYNFAGRIALSEQNLLATCLGTYWDGSNVHGACLYSSGRHVIHFRIEHKGSNNLFFGIKTTSHDIPLQTLTSPYTYGWRELDQPIESINGHRVHTDRNMRTGDEVTMTLDCNNRQIFLEHHRINMTACLPVDLEKCPFPWRIFVTLRSPGDSIRILM